MNNTHDILTTGEKSYRAWREKLLSSPGARRIYEEEARKKSLWLQLVEARQDSGLTQVEVAKRMRVSQAQVARIEKKGYETYTLRTLQRYVEALGKGFELNVAVRKMDTASGHAAAT